MAKFVIECPQCGNSVEASNFIFAKKKIPCSCGHIIDVKTDKLSSKVCPHCGNTVVYDQTKGEKAKCPVCHELINTTTHRSALAEFTCPTCSCKLSADKNASLYDCPLCGTTINVQERIAKEKIKNEGIVSVVKYEGGDNVLVWKHPVEDFNMGSQLIVHESQEAIFFRDGKALDLFGAGRYTLSTQNLPGLEKLYKLPTNTTEYFHSEVYFINTAAIMGIKWGTDSKVRVLDPATGIPLELGASGEFNIKVSDARKLLLKVVGTTGGLTATDVIAETGGVDIKSMTGKFRALIMNKVKSTLARSIRENAISILEIDEQLDVLSVHLQEQINGGLQEYGLILPEFFITTIVTPDDDPNFKRLRQQGADQYLRVNEERIRKSTVIAAGEVDAAQAEAAARVKLIGAEADADAYRMQAAAEADEMKMKGYTYQQETARQVGVGAVTTEHGGAGGSGAIGDIASVGIGLGVMKEVIDMTKGAMTPGEATPSVQTSEGWDCPKCGAKGITAKFCGECGAAKPVAWDCPKCGTKGITAKFCGECGTAKPEAWDCPKCGAKGITAKFCGECGTAKPEGGEAE
ncbi:MAG: SPFH domain-containing protein [Methanocorpusculum sp.]|nr:SPFH domain-containing protein [Oscillospiraceae bacterium]MBQ3571178.1 SPFH domain-containing protein [Methanocorpusculum sp.]